MRPLIAVVLGGCAHASQFPPTVESDAITVGTAPVDVQPVRAAVHGAGRLEAADEVTLSFAAGGIVARVTVEAGDAVTRGQTLAYLDATPARARLVGAQSA